MAVTGINSEDRLVQATFAAHLKSKLGWETVTAWNDEETFGPPDWGAILQQSKDYILRRPGCPPFRGSRSSGPRST